MSALAWFDSTSEYVKIIVAALALWAGLLLTGLVSYHHQYHNTSVTFGHTVTVWVNPHVGSAGVFKGSASDDR